MNADEAHGPGSSDGTLNHSLTADSMDVTFEVVSLRKGEIKLIGRSCKLQPFRGSFKHVSPHDGETPIPFESLDQVFNEGVIIVPVEGDCSVYVTYVSPRRATTSKKL